MPLLAEFSPLFSGFHYASFGIVELAAALIEIEGCDVNQGDPKSGMPLYWLLRVDTRGIEAILECQDTIPNKSAQEE